MQKYLIFLAVLFLVSCKNNTSTKMPTASNTEKESMLQWINLEGNTAIRKQKKVVLLSGDEEYRSEEVLPQMAQILSHHHGFDCTVLFAQDPAKTGIIDPNYVNNIPGLEALENADLMILFIRFRELPDEQMEYFQNYLIKGKPIIGMRTATHAFNILDSLSQWKHWGNYYDGELEDWEGGFGKKILGANWHTHHGHHKYQSTRGVLASESKNHPMLRNIDCTKIWGPTDVYGHPLPLPGDAQILVLGQVIDSESFDKKDLLFGMKSTDQIIATVNNAAKEKYNPNDPMMPIVWTKSYQIENGKKGKTITSTIGASTDYLNEELRRLLVNAVYHLLDLPIPENTKATLVGDYKPTQFNFHTDEYWEKKDLKVSDFAK